LSPKPIIGFYAIYFRNKLHYFTLLHFNQGFVMLENYRQHVTERAETGVVPKPLNATQTAQLVELFKNPPADETDFILDLLANRIPAGVDE
jgi:hypothetical protein